MPCIHRKLRRTCMDSMKRFMHDTFREKRVFRVLFSASSVLPFMKTRIQRLQFCNSTSVVFLDENRETRRFKRYQCQMQWHNMEIHMFLLFEGDKENRKCSRMIVIPETVEQQLAYVNLVKHCMKKERRLAIKSARKEFTRRQQENKPNDDDKPIQFKCCICQEEHLSDLCALQCGHVMHSDCASKCEHCPLCKKKIQFRTKLFI